MNGIELMCSDNPTSTPMIWCPACWTPQPVTPGKTVYECINHYCPMDSQDFKLYLFENAGDALSFRANEGERILKQYVSVSDQKHYVVPVYRPPMDRFHLLSGIPLEKLVRQDHLMNWLPGAIKSAANQNFRIYALEYSCDTGRAVEDEDGLLKIKEFGRSGHEGWCSLCATIDNAVSEKQKSCPHCPNPCMQFDREFVTKIFKFAQSNEQKVRHWVALADSKISGADLRDHLSEACWAGLVNFGIPILIFDVVVGVAVLSQKRVEEIALQPNRVSQRDQTLRELAIAQDTFAELFAKPDIERYPTLADVVKPCIDPIRITVDELQRLAFAQYGTRAHAKTQILIQDIRNRLHELNDELLKDESASRRQENIWTRFGPTGLEQIARFFSFYRAYVFDADETEIMLNAYWQDPKINDPKPTLGPIGLLPGNSVEDRIQAYIDGIVPGNPASVRLKGASNTTSWFVFTDRRYSNNKPRGSFNLICQDLLIKMIRAFDADMGLRVVAARSIDELKDMVHNMKGPAAQLASALAHVNKILYTVAYGDIKHVFKEHPLLHEVVDILTTSIQSASRRLDTEVNRVTYAGDMKRTMVLEAKPLPITGKDVDSNGRYEALWARANESIEAFVGVKELRKLTISSRLMAYFTNEESIHIHPILLDIVLDNLADNAVKYAFDETEIVLKLMRETVNNIPYAVYSISNYGHGIRKDEDGKIGTKHYRGIHSSTRNHKKGGMGLGVYLIKSIVERANGTWKWESHHGGTANRVAGEGFQTTFSIYLPIYR